MKKFISLLLSLTMVFSLAGVAFASEKKTPVIVVSGMGTDQYVIGENGEKTRVWPPQGADIAKAVAMLLPAVTGGILTGNYSAVEPMLTGLKNVFMPLSCDENGTLLKNVTGDIYPLPISEYPDDFNESNDTAEKAICRSVGDEIGDKNSYFFNYTWSRNPMEHADDLEKYIDSVLSQTKSRKVSLIACSMGGTITMSYLYKYGTSKIKNVVFASTAFLGTEIVGQLFTKDVNISIYDALAYFSEFTGYDFVQTLVVLAQKGMGESDIDLLGTANGYVEKLVDSLKEIAFSGVFLDTFVTMPGIWALMPHSYYEKAKETLVTDKSKYAFFERDKDSIDEYMYCVQSKAEKIIAKTRENGVNVYVTATYLCSGIPVMSDASNYTDNLIDVKYAGGYATVAKYGETLDSALGTVCTDKSHSHLSPDALIDASTCILPEQTWFIKNVGHMAYVYDTGLCSLLAYLSTSMEEVSIYSNPLYPQFTEYNTVTEKLTSDFENDRSDISESYITLLIELLRKLIVFFVDLFTTVR